VQDSQRLAVFIDDKNFYKGARDAFFAESSPHIYGQIKPFELAKLMCSRSPPGIARQLLEVRVYTGVPDATKDPKTYSAHMKQHNAWLKMGVKVVARPLRYPKDWPESRAQQKGVDVALAVDFVTMAIDGKYDVGVVASTDSDLKPALEYVYKKCRNKCYVEVASWDNKITKSRLSVRGANLWCYWLDKADYDSVADLVDYTL